ncbi:MAG: SRPBCC family protein [Polyangiaceae bacterium]
MTEAITLVVRRTIRASAERVFDAWTLPEHLRAWWGPRPVTCSGAEVDLRVGGRYRIDNAIPDGTTVVIEGEFRAIERPRRLVYTWRMGGESAETSLVTVCFEERGDATEVVIVHEQVPSAAARDSHEKGWNGCLDGLGAFFPAR